MLEPVPPLPRRVNGRLCFRRLFITALSRSPPPPPPLCPLLLIPVISDIKEIVSMRARVSSCKVYSPLCCRRAVVSGCSSGCSSGCERIRNDDSHKMCASRARGLGGEGLPAEEGRRCEQQMSRRSPFMSAISVSLIRRFVTLALLVGACFHCSRADAFCRLLLCAAVSAATDFWSNRVTL